MRSSLDRCECGATREQWDRFAVHCLGYGFFCMPCLRVELAAKAEDTTVTIPVVVLPTAADAALTLLSIFADDFADSSAADIAPGAATLWTAAAGMWRIAGPLLEALAKGSDEAVVLTAPRFAIEGLLPEIRSHAQSNTEGACDSATLREVADTLDWCEQAEIVDPDIATAAVA